MTGSHEVRGSIPLGSTNLQLLKAGSAPPIQSDLCLWLLGCLKRSPRQTIEVSLAETL